MATSILERIEADINQLSLLDQLRLMEHMAQRIRQCSFQTLIIQESDLAAMAHDPAIQRELQQMNVEFAITDADGLDVRQK